VLKFCNHASWKALICRSIFDEDRGAAADCCTLLVRPGSLSSLLVSSLDLCVKVEFGVVDLLLILAALASRDGRLLGSTST
jgi:hypothetical protein